MSRAAAFELVAVTPDIVYIADISDEMCTVTVTNDADNVVKRLNHEHPGKRIVYRDTMLMWDELVHDHGVFKGFRPLNFNVPQDVKHQAANLTGV